MKYRIILCSALVVLSCAPCFYAQTFVIKDEGGGTPASFAATVEDNTGTITNLGNFTRYGTSLAFELQKGQADVKIPFYFVREVEVVRKIGSSGQDATYLVAIRFLDGPDETFIYDTAKGWQWFWGVTRFGEFKSPLKNLRKITFMHEGKALLCKTSGYLFFTGGTNSPITGEAMVSLQNKKYVLSAVKIENYIFK